jgi:hypothetical protein
MQIARGLMNYYTFVNNYTRVRARVLYLLKYSCALTLASKFRLGTLKKTFNELGYDFNKKGGAQFNEELIPTSAPGFKLKGIIDYDPLSIIDLAYKAYPRTTSLLKNACKICGETNDIEIHHVKHLRKGAKNGDLIDKMMKNINRKIVI